MEGKRQNQPARLDGRSALVTGTGGLGFEVALSLARANASVVLAGRNRLKGAQAIAEIKARFPFAVARFEHLDLASLASVREFVTSVKCKLDKVDILVCNAGIMSPPKRRTTEDGCELQFGVNYLAHFALVDGLFPLLRQSSAPRVVSTTSLAHRYAKLDFDDLQSERKYVPGIAYCRSKLAQAMFAKELQRRSDEADWGLRSVAAHPGFARTNLFRSESQYPSLIKGLGMELIGALVGQSVRAGAAPIIYAATAPDIVGGVLYGPKGLFEMKGDPGLCQFASAVDDQAAARKLWRISEDLAGARFLPHDGFPSLPTAGQPTA